MFPSSCLPVPGALPRRRPDAHTGQAGQGASGIPCQSRPAGAGSTGPGSRSSCSGGRSPPAGTAPAQQRGCSSLHPTQTGRLDARPLQCPSASVPRWRILPPDFALAVPKPVVKEAASAGPRRAARTLRLAPGRSGPRPRRRWRAERGGAASEGRALPGRVPGV
ncbi:unnamed protein product [Coccothraustes coccothraustes]